jgi:hypothetical protein
VSEPPPDVELLVAIFSGFTMPSLELHAAAGWNARAESRILIPKAALFMSSQ